MYQLTTGKLEGLAKSLHHESVLRHFGCTATKPESRTADILVVLASTWLMIDILVSG